MTEQTIEVEPNRKISSARVRLRVIEGPHTGLSWTFGEPTRIVVGRQSPSHLKLPDERAASREHLHLHIDPPVAELVDNESRNGTSVNGVRLVAATITDGDVISIGRTQMAFELLRTEPVADHLSHEHSAPSDIQLTASRFFEEPVVEQLVSVAAQPDPRLSNSDIEQTRVAMPEFDVECDQIDQLPAENFNTPRRIGDYHLVALLGQGAMASVYLAKHRESSEAFAIKQVRKDVPITQKMIDLFLRETSVITGLNHPRIVRAFHSGVWESMPYLVLEYIDKLHFDTLLQHHNVTDRIKVATWTISRVLQAIHYAHDKGVVHRDIKPDNILAYREDQRLQVKLSDFGLAKFIASSPDSAMTGERSFRGSVAYMAPEQFESARDVGPLADLFSCGACLYRLVTGQVPNRVLNPKQTLATLDEDTTIPIALRKVIRKSIEIQPQNRFQTATEMAEALFPFHGRP